ncbi:MAG: hypothetical protein IKE05_03750 [Clostridia bacterium]|nr:hypothetical protein [Clostridia bacterium]
MKNVENKSGTSEKINAAMMEDKDFCIRIVNCKDRDEVKKFLSSKGIEASDNDIDNLAANISEIADICKKIDDIDLDNVVGGGKSDSDTSDDDLGFSDDDDSSGDGGSAGGSGEFWKAFSTKTSKAVGIGAVVAAGVLVLSFVGAGIKKLGDQKGWWDKYRNKN